MRDLLAGRRANFSSFKQQWQAAIAGQLLVTISGEPGVGKTSPGRRVHPRCAEQRRNRTARRLHEYEATTPHLPFVERCATGRDSKPVDTPRRLPPATAAEPSQAGAGVELKLGSLPPNPPCQPARSGCVCSTMSPGSCKTWQNQADCCCFDDLLGRSGNPVIAALSVALSMRGDRVLVLAAYREVELSRTHPLPRRWWTGTAAVGDALAARPVGRADT